MAPVNSFNNDILFCFIRLSKGILVHKLNWSVSKVPRAAIVSNLLPIILKHIWFQSHTVLLTNCKSQHEIYLYHAQFSQL